MLFLTFADPLPNSFGIPLLMSDVWCMPSSWKSALHACHITLIPFTEIKQSISLSVPRVKPNACAKALHFCAPSLWNNCRCLSVQPFQLLPPRSIWKHISLAWPFPYRHQHARWLVDVTKLFHRFCCWTPIQLLRHWVWLAWGFWRYKNFIDWLIWACIIMVVPIDWIWVIKEFCLISVRILIT